MRFHATCFSASSIDDMGRLITWLSIRAKATLCLQATKEFLFYRYVIKVFVWYITGDNLCVISRFESLSTPPLSRRSQLTFSFYQTSVALSNNLSQVSIKIMSLFKWRFLEKKVLLFLTFQIDNYKHQRTNLCLNFVVTIH